MQTQKYLNFPIDFSQTSYFRTIGLGTVLLNFVVQKMFRVNKSTRFMVHYTSRINVPRNIFIADDTPVTYQCFASSNCCYMNATNKIYIGKNVMFASGVKLISANHDFKNREEHQKEKPITIADNVWLGANVIILPGITIGENAIIGAGSVVTKNIEANSIYAGNPAKKLREI